MNKAYVVDGETMRIVEADKLQKGMIVEYAPAWRAEGEEKYIHVITDMWENDGHEFVKISTINTNIVFGSTEVVWAEMIQPADIEKVNAIGR